MSIQLGGSCADVGSLCVSETATLLRRFREPGRVAILACVYVCILRADKNAILS